MARLVFFIVCLSLAGCGTDVRELLRDDNRLAWEVEEAVASAEDAGSGLDRDMQRAEVAKMDACKEIYEATDARMEREMGGDGLSFTEQFWADLCCSSFVWSRCPASSAAPRPKTTTSRPMRICANAWPRSRQTPRPPTEPSFPK